VEGKNRGGFERVVPPSATHPLEIGLGWPESREGVVGRENLPLRLAGSPATIPAGPLIGVLMRAHPVCFAVCNNGRAVRTRGPMIPVFVTIYLNQGLPSLTGGMGNTRA